MQMLLRDPPPDLAGDIVQLWALSGAPAGEYSGLPKPYAEVVISLSGKHRWREDLTAQYHSYTAGWITPVQSGPRFAATTGPLHLVGARISLSGAANLFGGAALFGGATPIDLTSLMGGEVEFLRDQLATRGSDTERLQLLAQWLRQQLSPKSPRPMPNAADLGRMAWHTDALAEHFGLSPRGLRNRFQRDFGIGPKFWLQLHRFDALLGSNMTTAGLADCAFAFGFADQAHMTREFARFSGVTPGRYFNQRRQADTPEEAPHFVP